jgi:hypothetical protein
MYPCYGEAVRWIGRKQERRFQLKISAGVQVLMGDGVEIAVVSPVPHFHLCRLFPLLLEIHAPLLLRYTPCS